MTNIIPAHLRKIVYTIYAAIGLAIGAVQVAYASANIEQPVWLTVLLAVFAFLGTSLGLTAAANVNTEPRVVQPAISPEAVEHTSDPQPDNEEFDKFVEFTPEEVKQLREESEAVARETAAHAVQTGHPERPS